MIGKTLGQYEILELLGKGGMGEVYRAVDSKLGRDVAIKFLSPEFSSDVERPKPAPQSIQPWSESVRPSLPKENFLFGEA